MTTTPCPICETGPASRTKTSFGSCDLPSDERRGDRRRRKIALDERAWDNDKTEAAAVSQATAAAGRAAAAAAGTLRIHGASCGDGCGRRGRAEPGGAGLLLRVVTLT
jgi:hypothetical protein